MKHMRGEEDQQRGLLFPLPVVKLGDLDDGRGGAEGRAAPADGRSRWQDLTSVRHRADVELFRATAMTLQKAQET